MELHRQTKEYQLQFKWKDVTFHIRSKATAGDQHELTTLGEMNKNGVVDIPRNKFYRRAVELFVVAWDGVTEGGKAIPFSMEAMERMPADQEGGDIIFQVGAFIYNNCFAGPDQAKKKG